MASDTLQRMSGSLDYQQKRDPMCCSCYWVKKIESTVSYFGIELSDMLEVAERIEA